MRELTEQEIFWAGEFGAQYLLRNTLPQFVEKAQRLWARVLSRMAMPPSRVLELGCNIGINLVALSRFLPEASLRGIEINKKAAEEAWRNLSPLRRASVINCSLFDATESVHDFVFTCVVLFHLNPLTSFLWPTKKFTRPLPAISACVSIIIPPHSPCLIGGTKTACSNATLPENSWIHSPMCDLWITASSITAIPCFPQAI